MDNKRELICRLLCKKEKCHSDLLICDGRQNRRCKRLGKSFICKMNEGQIDYVTSQLWKNTFLKACPGSGKTEVLEIKVAYEKEKWNILIRWGLLQVGYMVILQIHFYIN